VVQHCQCNVRDVTVREVWSSTPPWHRVQRHHSVTVDDAMMPTMRTTVTLDPDTAAIIGRRMRERGISFKQALNEAIRAGAGEDRGTPFRTATAPLGVPVVNLDRALQLAAELEDEELVRRSRVGK
jgi:hypothetical protein